MTAEDKLVKLKEWRDYAERVCTAMDKACVSAKVTAAELCMVSVLGSVDARPVLAQVRELKEKHNDMFITRRNWGSFIDIAENAINEIANGCSVNIDDTRRLFEQLKIDTRHEELLNGDGS